MIWHCWNGYKRCSVRKQYRSRWLQPLASSATSITVFHIARFVLFPAIHIGWPSNEDESSESELCVALKLKYAILFYLRAISALFASPLETCFKFTSSNSSNSWTLLGHFAPHAVAGLAG